MRWGKQKLSEGDIRIIEKFLIFPKCIDEEWRWWERVIYEQKYTNYKFGSFDYTWIDIKWIN